MIKTFSHLSGEKSRYLYVSDDDEIKTLAKKKL